MFDKNLWNRAKKHLSLLSATIAFGAVLGGLVVLQAWLLSKVISGVFMDGKTLEVLRNTVGWLGVVILLRAGVSYGREFFAGKLSIHLRADLSEDLVAHLLHLSPVQVSGEQAGEITNTVVQGIDRLDAYFRTYLPQLALSVILPVTILIVVFPLDWVTGIVFLFTAPLIPLFMMLIGQEAEKETNRQWKLLSKLSGHFFEVLQGLRLLKAFGLSKRQGKTIRTASEQYTIATLRVLRIAFLSALVLEMLATISTAVVAVQIGLRLMYGRIDFMSSLFILILAPEYYFPLRQLGAAFHSGMEGVSAAERIFELMQTPSIQVESLPEAKQAPPSGGSIAFQDVHFSYQDGERPSLSGVSFSIPWGKQTALVGPSGAGKSTLFGLLMGFIRPDSGQVLVSSTSLEQIDVDQWRSQISWIPQFPFLFNDTVAANLRLADPDASDEALIAAARQANADEFIQRLPQGYETKVGEKGAKISGGQAQRLSIARAFLRDAPILLLDEPTTNLDVANERLIQEALEKLMVHKTVIMIAHKRTTIRQADHIVVLDRGKVVQVGSPLDLREQPGFYRRLVGLEGAA
ncbi:thiol reductant ABC exporter subunit CydD [bacterium]|nr:thiol reductant ABC exporter subunit CydD [bacterium]